MIKDKTIVLGITGGIAAYKAAELASRLVQSGATVKPVMTRAATEFIAPLTFRSLTRQPVVIEMFDKSTGYIGHVAMAEAADLVVIAPATANTLAKIACGMADNFLTATVLATEAPVLVVPAMNVNMYQNPVTQENLEKLRKRHFIIVDPEYGRLASGKMGMGRYPETDKIIAAIEQACGG